MTHILDKPSHVDASSRHRQRSRTRLWVGLIAAGATLGLAALRWQWSSSGADAMVPELRALYAALAQQPARVVAGRLSGGFPYAPIAVVTRGSRSDVSPDVQIAAALIEKRAGAATSASYSAALGAAYLSLGEWDKAIAALDDAVDAAPGNASFENDRAVAYIGRATAFDRAEDWATALALANRAIARDPRRPEAHFNRAMALHGLHLTSEELEAWPVYQRIETSGPWFEESARRLEALRTRPRAKIDDPGVWDHQWVRERIEDRLLRDWGHAFERGDDKKAAALLSEAGTLAQRLAMSGGDRMAHDEIGMIQRALASGARASVSALATGHRLYGEARELFLKSNRIQADALMSRAAAHFSRARSPYAQWAPIFRGIVQQDQRDNAGALNQLQAVALPAPESGYYHLRGRQAWVEGYLWSSQGRFDIARVHLARSVEEFRQAAEYDYLAATHMNLAEADSYLGDRSSAWTNLAAALETLDRRGETRRIDQFDISAAIALDDDLPETSLEFRNAMVRVVTDPYLQAQAYLRRGRALARLSRPQEAALDTRRAEDLLPQIADVNLRDRTLTDLRVVQAELAGEVDCGKAITYADQAIQALAGPGTIRLGAMLSLRATCRVALGDREAARTDLRDAIGVFERRRAAMAAPRDRAQAFLMERSAYRRLLELDLVDGDGPAAFATAERARVGILAEAWGRDSAGIDHSRLAPGVAVVYYESLPDRVLTWVLTRAGRSSLTRDVSDAQVRRWVADVRRAIDRGVDVQGLRSSSTPLFEALVAPALAVADRGAGAGRVMPTIVFVPDGPLFGVPFAALPDRQGRALIETRTISTAPSLRTLILASDRLASFVPTDVLAVGDGHDPSTSRLSRLPRADDEAIEVGRIYPRQQVLTGADATKRRFLERPANVVHFAGHSILNERDPMLSKMLLAPDPGTGDSGWLLASEITPARFGKTGVVVLATCEGAAGRPVEGEGAISLARAFFAAGVPAVVASLWPVDDDLQTLMTGFHRALKEGQDPAHALRSGQQALLVERGTKTSVPVRVWGGFIMLGGLGPAVSQ
jgi:CHAT domain-containing protein/tetratricopeptide (TPR) repeat protein